MSCLDDILKQKPPGEAKCPDDGEVLKREEVFRDKCAQKEILALECYCPNKSLGCLWTGLLARLQDHDGECPYTKVKCPYSNLGCNVVILRHQLAKHVENDCVYKVTKCPYCQVGYPGVKMREHLEECGKFPVKCPYDCGESEILRENIPEHLEECGKFPVKCPYDCGESEILRENIPEHLEECGKFPVKCPYDCGESEILRENIPEHLEECGKFPVKCPFDCGESEILRENIPEHLLSSPRAPTPCRFKFIGRDFEGPRDSLDEHLSSSIIELLKLSTKSVGKLTDELRNLKVQLNISQAMNRTYEERLALQNEALALNRQTLSTHQMKLTIVEEHLSAQRTSIDEIRQQLTTELNSRENTTAGLNLVDIIRPLDFQDERLAVSGEDVRRLNQALRSAGQYYNQVEEIDRQQAAATGLNSREIVLV